MLGLMLRALIVDDEPPARRRLMRLIEQLAASPALPAVTVVGEASDGEEALTMLAKTSASLLFLDIHMPGIDGLALAQRHHGLPPIVFTTAYDQHAVAAFAVHAVDYLLKPIRSERLAQAITRAAQRVQALAAAGPAASPAGTTALLSELGSRGGGSPRIVVQDRGSGVALHGLRERLRILYPDADPPATLDLQSPANRPGCLVVLRLPLSEKTAS